MEDRRSGRKSGALHLLRGSLSLSENYLGLLPYPELLYCSAAAAIRVARDCILIFEPLGADYGPRPDHDVKP